MRRRVRITLLVITLVAALAVPSFAWKFASMADSRGSNNGINQAVLSNIITRINAENVDLLIFQGDAVTGSSSDTTLASQMDNWLLEMNKLNCPWYYTPGNHEIGTSTAEVNVLRPRVDQPLNGPLGYEEFVFSFDYQNAHFAFLNSDHYGEQHKVQLDWLTTDLEATSQTHIFVMAHDPAYPLGPHIGSSLDLYPTERDEFWNIMTEAGVRMYFCGHEHFYARNLHGNIYQVINGTCGAPLSTGYSGTIAQYHYVIVEVNGNHVDCVAKNDSGAVIDTWDYTVTPPASIASLKALPGGSPVYLADKTVTVGNDQLTSTIYIEELDRSSGIKIAATSPTVKQGDKIHVSGTLGVSQTERQISSPTFTIHTGPFALPPSIGMVTRDVGGASLNGYTPGVTGGVGTHNTGLLVTIWGKVTYRDTTGKLFYVDDGCRLEDGSGQKGVQVYCGGRPTGNNLTMPDTTKYAVVTGISTRRVVSGQTIRCIRPRKQTDIVPY